MHNHIEGQSSVNPEQTTQKKSWTTTFDKETTQQLREKHIGPSVQIFFKHNPLKIVRGQAQYLFDEAGQKYLDCINNVTHVGHCHPTVIDACTEQMQTLNTNCRFLHDNILQLAKRITATLPAQLSVCYFVNSGSEANDLAMRLSRYYTHSKEMIVLNHAYHGHLISTTSISPYKLNHSNCEDERPDWLHVVSTPDGYRGKFRDNEGHSPEELAHLYAEEVKAVCDELKLKGKKPAAFIAESMQSCGGQVVFPPGYLDLVYKHIHEAGGLCIADEVQCGFGRVGSHMWCFQREGVEPDIVVMGKSMGNGYPVSCVVTTPDIARAFRRGPDYFNTYGGNPVSCAVALAVLDVLEKENLLQHATDVGQHAKKLFMALKKKHPIVGDVRGVGLFLGIDLVKSRLSREPAVKEAEAVLWELRDMGILMSLDGPFSNILKLKPPMCFTRENAELVAQKLDEVLFSVEQRFRVLGSPV